MRATNVVFCDILMPFFSGRQCCCLVIGVRSWAAWCLMLLFCGVEPGRWVTISLWCAWTVIEGSAVASTVVSRLLGELKGYQFGWSGINHCYLRGVRSLLKLTAYLWANQKGEDACQGVWITSSASILKANVLRFSPYDLAVHLREFETLYSTLSLTQGETLI